MRQEMILLALACRRRGERATTRGLQRGSYTQVFGDKMRRNIDARVDAEDGDDLVAAYWMRGGGVDEVAGERG